MKKQFLLILTAVTFFSCDVKRKDKIADDSKTDSIKAEQARLVQTEALKNTTTVQLIDSVYNFGTITEGEQATYSYRFKNTGTNPLVIFEAHGSCGCTVPERPEKPILPGETGFLKVVFNSSGKRGHNEKDITVSANTNPSFPVLKLTGEVLEKK
jgi:Protein of unknown function (DUF1573)